MSKIPSAKSLRFLTLFTIIIIFSYSYIGWAYLLEQAQEYRFKADKFQGEGELDQAIEYYEKAIGLNKNCVAAYNNVAICYEKKGWLSRAEEWYLRALEINPQYAPTHYNLGLLYEKQGNIEKAVFCWKQRLCLGHAAEPANIKARAKLKRYAPEELKEGDAAELAQDILQQKEQSSLDKIPGRKKYITEEDKLKDCYLKGMQFYQEGDYRKAAECFHKMIEALPISN